MLAFFLLMSQTDFVNMLPVLLSPFLSSLFGKFEKLRMMKYSKFNRKHIWLTVNYISNSQLYFSGFQVSHQVGEYSESHVSPSLASSLNIDGSFARNSGHAIIGDLVWNDVGGWIYGCFKSCGHAYNHMIELCVILKGLQLDWDRDHHIIILESGSKFIINLIHKGNVTYHPYIIVLVQIRVF